MAVTRAKASIVRPICNGYSRASSPSSTKEQIKLGSHIPKEGLLADDLMFFKTSRQDRHVAVYIGDGKFVHASSRMGVSVSRLDNKYWSTRYELAQRISDNVA